MAGIGWLDLYPYQMQAIQKMKTGCILCGGVGSGKSRTALAYYWQTQEGSLMDDDYSPPRATPCDLYIITTARKRDTFEWDKELTPFLMSPDPEVNRYSNKIVVDSWNNIGKYVTVANAFFIFDEQRVVGSGSWVKSFLKITKNNQWILLSATPGDTWLDYAPVFIANGFYKNRSEFMSEHVVFSRYTKFPKVDRYLGTGRLIRLRNSILIPMDYHKPTESHHEDVFVDYDRILYKDICRNRWNVYDGKPIKNAAEFCYTLRRCVNTDVSREEAILELFKQHPRVIIFYNFDYELDILKSINFGCEVAEWNGHKHQAIPDSNQWVYLVQYTAGAEGWNCIKTDTIIFYSQNYSYKILTQSCGRIDRLNTPYTDLYYYHLKSRSGIDLAISAALKEKKQFNEMKFYRGK